MKKSLSSLLLLLSFAVPASANYTFNQYTGVADYYQPGPTVNQDTGSIGLTVDGGGSAVTTGSKGFITVPFAGTITNWYLAADQTGSVVIDIKRSGSSIVGAGNKPTLSSAQSGNAAVSGWTSVAIAAGDIIEFNVDSASTLTRVNLVVKVVKS